MSTMLALVAPALLSLMTPVPLPDVKSSSHVVAALFDFDGTLAQSEDTHRRTFEQILDKEMDMDFWESQCVGHAPPEIIRRFRKQDAVQSIEEMVEARSKLFEGAIERGELPLTGGARELLQSLRERGVLCAVVTSGARGYIEKALRKLEIEDCFDLLVTGTDEAVQGRLKPDPFPYLHAAQLLDVAPERCVAFEDSVTGVDSARNAGMDVVVLAANVNEHLDKGSPGILERVPEFTGLCVPTLITRRAPVKGRAVVRTDFGI